MDSSEPVRTAVRFPLHLPVRLKTPEGDEVAATTENVSASGVLFLTDIALELDRKVDFTLAIPAAVLGTADDITVHCTGHVVRHEQADKEQKAAAVVIDKYSFEA
jgi:hypothetical protein